MELLDGWAWSCLTIPLFFLIIATDSKMDSSERASAEEETNCDSAQDDLPVRGDCFNTAVCDRDWATGRDR